MMKAAKYCITRVLLHHRNVDAMQSRERNLLLDLRSGTESFESTMKSHEARHRAIRRLRVSRAIKTLKIPEILSDHGFKSHILSAYLNENPDCTALSNRAGEARRGQGSRNICEENM